ncbi:hypothetical protein, partial [Streptomyces europaeiscabiei]|uniref:hypothetical protein n=1 Tax=Streptomyces europaeiscabiei TaxID=146819 RepID=UPI001C1E155D
PPVEPPRRRSVHHSVKVTTAPPATPSSTGNTLLPAPRAEGLAGVDVDARAIGPLPKDAVRAAPLSVRKG